MIELKSAKLVRSQVQVHVLILFVNQTNSENLASLLTAYEYQIGRVELDLGQRWLTELDLENEIEVTVNIDTDKAAIFKTH